MNKYEILLGTAKSYVMLAKAMNSAKYTKAAKNALNAYKAALENDKTKTMKFKAVA